MWWEVYEILYVEADWDSILISPTPTILESKMNGRHIGKSIVFGYNFTTESPLRIQFCTKKQYPTTMTVKRQKFRIVKIQDGGRICTHMLAY